MPQAYPWRRYPNHFKHYLLCCWKNPWICLAIIGIWFYFWMCLAKWLWWAQPNSNGKCLKMWPKPKGDFDLESYFLERVNVVTQDKPNKCHEKVWIRIQSNGIGNIPTAPTTVHVRITRAAGTGSRCSKAYRGDGAYLLKLWVRTFKDEAAC